MDASEYLKSRVEDQISWYDKKSQWNQKLFKMLQATIIISASLIPLLIGYSTHGLIKFAIGFLGSLTAILSGILSLFRFKEHWTEYRTTSETLKHEKYLYLTGKGPYAVDDPFSILVERTETLISRENTKWYEWRIQLPSATELNPVSLSG